MSKVRSSFVGQSNEKKYKVILVGDSNVGKTALFLAFTEGQSTQDRTTKVTAVDFRLQNVKIQNQLIKLHIWDTAGQQRYRSIVSTYFKGCHGIIIVFDISSRQTFQNATHDWFDICKTKAPTAQVILIGNKTDLEPEIEEKQISQWCQQNGVSYVLTSVKSFRNIEQPFTELSNKILIKDEQHQKKKRYTPHRTTQSRTCKSSTNMTNIKISSKSTSSGSMKSEKKKQCC